MLDEITLDVFAVLVECIADDLTDRVFLTSKRKSELVDLISYKDSTSFLKLS